MFFIVHLKHLNISLDVSQISTLQELLKNKVWHSSPRNTKIASIRPLKQVCKTYRILHISLRRPPDGVT